MKRFLSILLAAVMLLSIVPAASMAETQYATVVGGWLRLRSNNDFNASTISSYYTGTTVQIISSSHGWYKVLAPDGKSGWMYGQYLQIGTKVPSGSGSAYVISYNGYGVRLRTGPSTSYRIIRTYPVGTPVTVLERGNNWSRISINGTTGYMMSQFLNFGGSSTGGGSDNIVCYATIWSRNGYGVRLRTGPSTSYGKIGVYSVGTTVAVLEKGPVWDLIRVGSRVGWMMNEFLYYHSTHELTSVTLNNDGPVVGSVLSVKAISPSTATVSYSWLVDGVERGTSSTYTVTAADEGKKIQLKVTGTGKYTGSVTSASTNKVLSNTILTSVRLSSTAPIVGNKLTATVEPEGATVAYAWKVGGFQVSNASTYTVAANDVGKEIQLVVTGNGAYSGMVSATTAAVTANGVLQGVSIKNETSASATAPTVGDKLTAVLSPAQATATYQWLRSGSAISGATSASYTVQDADVGATLSVIAVANGQYSGTQTSSPTTTVLAKPTKPIIEDITLPNGKVNEMYSTVLTAQGGTSYTWALANSSALPSGLTLTSEGFITGTPLATGTTTFSVVATNSVGTSDPKEFTLMITDGTQIISDTLTDDGTQTGSDTPTGDGTQTGDNTQPGSDTPTGGDTQPGSDTPTGDGTQTGDNTQPGSDTPTGGDTQPGSDTPTGDGTQTGDNTQPGSDTPTGGDTQPGSDTPTGGDTQPGSDTPTGGDTQPGSDTPTGDGTQTGSDTPTGGDTQPGSDTPTDGDTQPGSDAPTGGDTQPGSDTPTDGDTQPDSDAPTSSDAQAGSADVVPGTEQGSETNSVSLDTTDSLSTVSLEPAPESVVQEPVQEPVVQPQRPNFTISPSANVTVAPGESMQFKVVSSLDSSLLDMPEGYVWKVSDSTSSETRIGENGLLTVGADETAETLTVKLVMRDTGDVYEKVKVTVIAY